MSSSVTIVTVCGTSNTGTGVLRAVTWSEYRTLPFTRISPDHGPNEKMVGQNKSNPLSLVQALKFLDKNWLKLKKV